MSGQGVSLLQKHALTKLLSQKHLAMSDQKQQSAKGAGSGMPQVEQQNMQFIEETGRWTYTDAEGISFEYDENLKAWFPMVIIHIAYIPNITSQPTTGSCKLGTGSTEAQFLAICTLTLLAFTLICTWYSLTNSSFKPSNQLTERPSLRIWQVNHTCCSMIHNLVMLTNLCCPSSTGVRICRKRKAAQASERR